MPVDDLLRPVSAENPGGQDLRYSPIYDRIKEARRQDDELAQGAWQHERKLADYPQVIKLAREALAGQSKDLQVAAWLTEALLHKQGFPGLRDGLLLCRGLLSQFWDSLYPQLEDGDAELRAAPLDWMSGRFSAPAAEVPLCTAGLGFREYNESRTVIPEDQAKSKEQRAAREAALKEGKTAPEVFDRSFAETTKGFYSQTEKDLDACLEALSGLDAECQSRFDDPPSWSRLRGTLEEIRHAVHGFLEKKRETDPDPVAEPEPEPVWQFEPAPAMAVSERSGAGAAVAMAPEPQYTYAPAELSGREDAVASIAAAAAWLRQDEPLSPAPYLLLRGLRWGELRAAKDGFSLEAPPAEVRRQVKALALAGAWTELLEAAETAMALPCGRAWLDLQRMVTDACAALGPDYDPIALAIRSELRALLLDIPELLDATLNDDTPAANPQTQAWLRELLAEPASGPASKLPRPFSLDEPREPGWRKTFVDPQQLADDAMRQGESQKAVEILNKDLERQRSGRGRFQRKLKLAQACVAAGKEAIAQPLLDDLAASVENHKLEDWEDHEWVAGVLLFLLQNSKKIQADAKAKQAFFDRICRLDPVQALSI